MDVCCALGDTVNEWVHDVGHPGIRRTLYFARKRDGAVSRQQVREVLQQCDFCHLLSDVLCMTK